jgi:hypothetical protein
MVGLAPSGETAVLAPLTTSVFVSLHTGDPGNTGTSEVSGGSYARVGGATFSNAADATKTVASNVGIITFAAASASWGTITHFGIWTASTAGNFLGSGAVTTPKAVGSGDTARFAAGALTITAQ